MHTELLRRIEASVVGSLASDRDCSDCGPFRLLLTLSSDMVWVNYAVPLRDGFEPQAVEALKSAFRERQRTPRLEFTKELWPSLPGALLAAGFEQEASQPTMVCTSETFVDRPADGVEIEAVGPDGEIETCLRLGDESFGVPSNLTSERIEGVQNSLSKGVWSLALARIGGEAAGCAWINPFEGVCELAGVGTLERFRRRGVASAASSFLLRRFFGAGGDIAWLSAGDDTAKAVYERLGFETIATRVNFSVPPGS